MDDILEVLKNLRIGFVEYEQHIHEEIKKLFYNKEVEYEYEYLLGKGNRVDFFIRDKNNKNIGCVVEVKKSVPNRTRLIKQLNRYAEFKEVSNIIVVSEKAVSLPEYIGDKRCEIIVLHRLWF